MRTDRGYRAIALLTPLALLVLLVSGCPTDPSGPPPTPDDDDSVAAPDDDDLTPTSDDDDSAAPSMIFDPSEVGAGEVLDIGDVFVFNSRTARVC